MMEDVLLAGLVILALQVVLLMGVAVLLGCWRLLRRAPERKAFRGIHRPVPPRVITQHAVYPRCYCDRCREERGE